MDGEAAIADVAADLLEGVNPNVILAALAHADLERADAVRVGLARQADGPLFRGYDLLRGPGANIHRPSPASRTPFCRFCSFPGPTPSGRESLPNSQVHCEGVVLRPLAEEPERATGGRPGFKAIDPKFSLEYDQ